MAERILPLYKESLAVENFTETNIEVLEAKQRSLEEMRLEPNLGPRQREEINRILGHIAFEINMRGSRDS